jgi:transcriptional regulator with XRE-family HTH domain
VKAEERQRARRLRKEEGLAVKEIARIVGVSVSSVSLSKKRRSTPETPHGTVSVAGP